MSTKYNRTFHLPWSPGTTNDDKISKDVSSLIGREIIITEKLDGENQGMDNGGVYARSHSDYTITKWTKNIRLYHSLHIKDKLPPETFLFCENLEAIHSIEYNNLSNFFYMIGVRTGNVWLSWDEVSEYSYLFDIPTVPLLFKGVVNSEKELKDLTVRLSNEQSILGDEREGIVVRVSESFNDKDFPTSVMKWVRKDHVTTSEHWTRNVKFAKLSNNE